MIIFCESCLWKILTSQILKKYTIAINNKLKKIIHDNFNNNNNNNSKELVYVVI
jgi:hypothetical protein